MKTMQNNEGDGNNRHTNQNTGAGAGRMVEPMRGGRGDMGAGGGRGVLLRSGKMASTRGGKSVRGDERARLAGDSAARWAAAVEDGGTVGAVLVGLASVQRLPVGVAMLSPYAAGGLLGECQGQIVLAVCSAMARKLIAKMRHDGKQPSSTTGEDAAAAGVVAVARWWAINARHAGQRARGSLVSVAWRVIVRESSRDLFGDSLPVWGLSDGGTVADTLAGSAVPLPAFTGDESRHDKAVRLVAERARAARPGQLAARLVSLAASSANGRRAQAVAKVGHAAALLLGGVSIDSAADSAGFKARGAGKSFTRAGDTLGQAVRRLGFGFQFNHRQSVKMDTLPTWERVTFGLGRGRNVACLCPVAAVPVSTVPALVRSWSFAPSAGLPAQRGTLTGFVVRGDLREASRKARATERKARAARLAVRSAVVVASEKRAARLAVRSAKLRGEFFGAFLPAVETDGAAVRSARLHASARRMGVWGAAGGQTV